MKKEEIKHTKIIVYHLNLNELIERANQNIKNYLQKFIQGRFS